MPIRTGEQ